MSACKRAWPQVIECGSTHDPRHFQLKSGDDDVKGGGVPAAMRSDFVNPRHRAQGARDVTGTVIFKDTSRKEVGLYAHDSRSFNIANPAQRVYNVPATLQDFNPQVASVFYCDSVGKDELLFMGFRELFLEFTADVNTNSFGSGAVYPCPLHAYNLVKNVD